MDEERLEKVEKLLREERGVELSPQFKQRVLAAVHALPAPELIAPRRSWRDMVYALKLLSSGEKVALGLILVGIAVFLLPSMGDIFAAFAWEFSDLTLSVSIGETALSASLLSVIAAAAGGLCMTGVSAYAAKNHLIGA